ncbi:MULTISPECIES: phage N-6-adenine-methyltransferase [unclassified Endozoicomonas]|uniref:phage N-6-adenine-methyltransferase n=1 Tax=unclassified Endozoicomonas TaxID=2644528 RepID=UPI002147FCBF|nr:MULTISPECIES: phage N-6-adenine-methyltransferase [unclassified Endozoicomonas]
MDPLSQPPCNQGQNLSTYSARAESAAKVATADYGNVYPRTVRPAIVEPSGVNRRDFTPGFLTGQKYQKKIEIFSGIAALDEEAFEAAYRNPKLDFTDFIGICVKYYIGTTEATAYPEKKSVLSTRPGECLDITDLSGDSLFDLISYQHDIPEGIICGDAITFCPLTSSDFDQIRSFLEEDLSLAPKDNVIIDAGSGRYCYHSALFALAGFTVRPYDYSPARSIYRGHGVAEKLCSPFLTPNDKDLTGDDITSSFFDTNSVLFMSFPDKPGYSFSLPLVKKYTESEVLNKVVVLLILDSDGCEGTSFTVSKETMDLLKENYELRKIIDTEKRPAEIQIHVRKSSAGLKNNHNEYRLESNSKSTARSSDDAQTEESGAS